MSRCRSEFHTSEVWMRGMDSQVIDSLGGFHTFHTFHTSLRAPAHARTPTRGRVYARAHAPAFLPMEGMEGMEEQPAMRFSSFHTSATPLGGMELERIEAR
jgi:hypothetical protein